MLVMFPSLMSLLSPRWSQWGCVSISSILKIQTWHQTHRHPTVLASRSQECRQKCFRNSFKFLKRFHKILGVIALEVSECWKPAGYSFPLLKITRVQFLRNTHRLNADFFFDANLKKHDWHNKDQPCLWTRRTRTTVCFFFFFLSGEGNVIICGGTITILVCSCSYNFFLNSFCFKLVKRFNHF